jgi:hypothetical protein
MVIHPHEGFGFDGATHQAGNTLSTLGQQPLEGLKAMGDVNLRLEIRLSSSFRQNFFPSLRGFSIFSKVRV